MKQRIYSISLFALFGLLLSSCGTSTKLTAHWAEKSYEKGQIKAILILGITKRPAVRGIFEDDMVEKLAYYGVEGTASSEIFPIDEKLDTTTFRLHFQNEGFDAVLTAQLVAEDKESHYEPGSSYYGGGYGYNRGFYGYYGSAYDNMYSPGYTVTTTTLKIETNLYDTKTEKLIWTGISETFNPAGESDAIRSLNREITKVLNEQGYFYKEPK